MSLHSSCFLLPFACGLLIGFSALPASAQCRYEATIIEGPAVGEERYSLVIPGNLNDLGQVCGSARIDISEDHAFVWSPKSGFQFIPEFSDAFQSQATAISNSLGTNEIGYVTGSMQRLSIGFRAFVYNGVSSSELGVLPGALWSVSEDINSSLNIVGQSLDPVNGTIHHAFLWKDGLMSDIHGRLPLEQSLAQSTNDQGDIVGIATPGSYLENRAVLWTQDKIIVFPPIPDGISSNAIAINNRGVIGISGLLAPVADGNTVPASASYLWLSNIWMPINSPLPSCTLIGLNDADCAVGVCKDLTASQGFSFIWRNGKLYKIADMVVQPSNIFLRIGLVDGINNRGQILTGGSYFIIKPFYASESVKFLLTPVPTLPGDTNCDGIVNIHDLTDVILDWNNPGGGADLNFDLTVDIQDLLEVVNNWGG